VTHLPPIQYRYQMFRKTLSRTIPRTNNSLRSRDAVPIGEAEAVSLEESSEDRQALDQEVRQQTTKEEEKKMSVERVLIIVILVILIVILLGNI
jgi:hypothetical protein